MFSQALTEQVGALQRAVQETESSSSELPNRDLGSMLLALEVSVFQFILENELPNITADLCCLLIINALIQFSSLTNRNEHGMINVSKIFLHLIILFSQYMDTYVTYF